MNHFFTSKTILACSLILVSIAFFQISANNINLEHFKTPIAERDTAKEKAKSLEAFKTILQVLKHPRCINCHPVGDRPRQGDDQHFHLFNVQRGADNHGGPVQKCQTCHHEENNPYSNVPGAPHWGLAPKSMGWFGLSDAEIGQRFIDKKMNGNRSPEELVHHMTHDPLVLWGWNPGGNRTPVDVPFEAFKEQLDIWLKNGAHVPSD